MLSHLLVGVVQSWLLQPLDLPYLYVCIPFAGLQLQRDLEQSRQTLRRVLEDLSAAHQEMTNL